MVTPEPPELSQEPVVETAGAVADTTAAAMDAETEEPIPLRKLEHADSLDILRAHPPHFHPSLVPPTFRVGAQQCDSDASGGAPAVTSSLAPVEENGEVRPGTFTAHTDSCDLLRRHPPNFDPSNANAPQPFRVGAQNYDSDAASDGTSPVGAAAGSLPLHHVDSTIVLRARRLAHPPKKRESPLQPVAFRAGERADSPKGSEQDLDADSSESVEFPEGSKRTFHHVDSVDILRRHPPQPGPSPLSRPTAFQVGRRADEDMEEAAQGGLGGDEGDDDDVEEGDEAEGGAEAPAALSKRQQKKLAKRQKAMERHAERKQREKAEKAKAQAAKKAEYNAYVASLTPEEKEEFQAKMAAKRQSRQEATAAKRAKLKEAMDSGQRVAIDLDFEDKMTEGELRSLCQQLNYCYSANCNSEKPFCLHFTSLKGKVHEFLLRQSAGLPKWQLNHGPDSYTETFAQSELVYLTADSPNVLSELDPAKVYVIGGIVDRNRYKGICYNKAVEQGLETAALPINVQLNTSRVLTVNHVLEIMLRFGECGDWAEAVEKVVPGRKRAVAEDDEKDGGSCGTEDEPVNKQHKTEDSATAEADAAAEGEA